MIVEVGLKHGRMTKGVYLGNLELIRRGNSPSKYTDYDITNCIMMEFILLIFENVFGNDQYPNANQNLELSFS